MQSNNLTPLVTLIRLYTCLVLVTIALLTIFSFTDSHLATKDAWTHTVIVAIFAVLLPLRARAAQNGKASALRAIGIISSVLFLVNIIEGLLPNYMPAWMRVVMFTCAFIMALIVGLVVAIRLKENH